MFGQEVERWFSLNHPHVLRLYGACHVGDRPFLVCEYASEGSFCSFLRLHPNQVWRKLQEVALGVEYLCERGFVHGALTCDSMVVASDGKAKVTYHGWAAAASSSVDLKGAPSSSYACQWVAPECLVGDVQTHTSASDIYSLGMCILEALRTVEARLQGEDEDQVAFPWGDLPPAAVKFFVKQRRLPLRPSNATTDQWGLVMRMCAHDPSQRPSIRDVVRDLKRLGWCALKEGLAPDDSTKHATGR